jgi:hypothetical protein
MTRKKAAPKGGLFVMELRVLELLELRRQLAELQQAPGFQLERSLLVHRHRMQQEKELQRRRAGRKASGTWDLLRFCFSL